MTFTGWLLAAAITFTAVDSRGADAPATQDVIAGYVCDHEYQPWITGDVCFGPNSYDWRNGWTAVMIENGMSYSITAASFGWNRTNKTSEWVYHDTVIPPGGNVQWQSIRRDGSIAVYVWCVSPKLPRIHNADGQGYCL